MVVQFCHNLQHSRFLNYLKHLSKWLLLQDHCHCNKNTNAKTWWPCICYWYWWMLKFIVNSRLLLSNWIFTLCTTTSWKYKWSSIICDVSFHWRHFQFYHCACAFGGHGSILPQLVVLCKVFEPLASNIDLTFFQMVVRWRPFVLLHMNMFPSQEVNWLQPQEVGNWFPPIHVPINHLPKFQVQVNQGSYSHNC